MEAREYDPSARWKYGATLGDPSAFERAKLAACKAGAKNTPDGWRRPQA